MPNDNMQDAQPDPPVRQETPTAIIKSVWAVTKSKAFWRIIVITSLITLFVFFGLGIACYFIVFGVLMAFLRISTIYPPAAQLMGAIIGLPKGKYLSEKITWSPWKKILISWPVIIYLGMAGVGIWLLLRNGFLAQNMIYVLFFK